MVREAKNGKMTNPNMIRGVAVGQQIEREVWDALLSEGAAAGSLDNARALFEAARENLDAAQEGYRQGLSSMIALVDARTAFSDAERILIQAV